MVKDTIYKYHNARIATNIKAMNVLGSWGLANIAGGTTGYLLSPHQDTKYFHQMNVGWGLVNTGIAAYGLRKCKQEALARTGSDQAYQYYKNNKKTLLINIGLDAAYIGTGFYLLQKAQKPSDQQDAYRGYGTSIILQGTCLLVFDNFLLSAHLKNNNAWRTIMHEIHFTGAGFSYVHTF